ncbi:hypothetical protein ACHAXM_002519 [Skeletonema potamos]
MDPRDPRYRHMNSGGGGGGLSSSDSQGGGGGRGYTGTSNSNNNPHHNAHGGHHGGLGRGGGGGGYHHQYHGGGGGGHRKSFGRGGGGGGYHSSNNNNNPNNNPAHKERELMNIYGRGGSAAASGGGGDDNNNTNSNNSNNISSNMGPPQRKYHNPCRFAGHDHEWKDCPNNFRNKKKNMMNMNNMNSHGSGLGLMGSGMNNNTVTNSGSGGGSGGGNNDHYGPASSSYEIGGGGGSGPPISDRPSIVGSRSQSDFYGSGGGDRGYPNNTNNNNNDRPSLLGSRSQSFGDNLRVSTGGGDGGMIKSHHYSPSPRSSFTSGGGGGGSNGDRRRNTTLFSPHPGPGDRGGSTGGVDITRPSPISSSSRGYSSSYTPSSSSYRKGGGGGRPHFSDDVINDVPIPPISSSSPGGGSGGGGDMMWSGSSPSKSPGEILSTPHSRSSGGSGGGEGYRGSGGGGGRIHHHTPHHYQQQQQRGSLSSKSSGGGDNIRPSPYNKSPGEIRGDMQNELGGGQQQHRGSFSKSPGEIRPSPYSKSPGEIRGDMQHESSYHRGSFSSLGKSSGEIRHRPSFESPQNSFAARQDSFGGGSSPRYSRETVTSSPRYYHGRGASGDVPFYSNNTSSFSREEGEEVIEGAARKTDEGLNQPTPHMSSNEQATKEPSPVKEEKPPSLTCSALKDEVKIRKAEDIICRMAKIMDNLSATVPSTEGLTPLPTKIEITKCMAELEKKIKAKGKQATTTKKQVREMEEQEKEERMRKEMKKIKDEERKAQEELDRRRQIEKEFEDRINERNQSVEDKREELIRVFNARKDVLSKERRSGRAKLESDCQAAIDEKVCGMVKEIFAVREKVKEAERTIQELDELAFQEANIAALPDMIDEDETDVVPTMDAPGKMSALISTLLARNQRTASEAHHDSLSAIPYFPQAAQGGETVSNEEWSNRARKVTGIHDALYLEPKDVPMFEENNRTFLELAPRMKEYIRVKNEKLKSRWEDLAKQYVTRQTIYKEETGVDLESSGGYFSAGKPIEIDEPAPRGNNPYRRPRRGISQGDVVRSEYEQEQIIAELAAKEAMEKRIKEGGCALPRQQGLLERQLFASYSNSFFGQRVDDMLANEEERRHVNIWTDMEKCIFLDRFLHHPKDFRKIATFLRNKSTKDCIEFYYDSKKTVPYKQALKEFLLRKKRRGDVVPWDATIQSALSVGATVKAGSSTEKPLQISIPDNDCTYHTKSFHPMKLEVFSNMEESVLHAKHSEDARKEHKSRRSNWFILESNSRKYLKHRDEKEHHHKRKAVVLSEKEEEPKKVQRKNYMPSVHDRMPAVHEEPPKRKHKAQKWKAEEKRLLYEALEKYGHDWPAISKAVGTRTDIQAKNYYHDNEEKITKQLNERAGNGKETEGVKVKKKPGRKKKLKDPPPPPAPSTTAPPPPPPPANTEGEGPNKRNSTGHSIDSSVSNTTSEQEENYRQQMILQQQQDHIRQQIHLQQQQQHIQRLVQQQQQEEMYRQHQEEMYRQQVHHLRQQELLHAHAQQFQHQQHYHEQMGQHNYETNQLQHLHHLLAMRGRQSPYYQGGGGGGDLERIFQAAAAAGIPQSALETALNGANGHQQQDQQQLSMELLRRIAQQQQHHQSDNNQYYGHGYGNDYQR